MNGEAGKGDSYRPVDQKKWSENYDRIFKQHDDSTPKQTANAGQATLYWCEECLEYHSVQAPIS